MPYERKESMFRASFHFFNNIFTLSLVNGSHFTRGAINFSYFYAQLNVWDLEKYTFTFYFRSAFSLCLFSTSDLHKEDRWRDWRNFVKERKWRKASLQRKFGSIESCENVGDFAESSGTLHFILPILEAKSKMRQEISFLRKLIA